MRVGFNNENNKKEAEHVEKIDEMEFSTSLSLPQLEKKLQRVFNSIGAEKVEEVSGSSANIKIQVSGKTAIFSPLIWLVQVFVWDTGNEREVTLNALGSSPSEFLATSIRREKGVAIDFAKSIKKRNEIKKYIEY